MAVTLMQYIVIIIFYFQDILFFQKLLVSHS